MAKKELDQKIKELRNYIQLGKVVLGNDRVLKGLRKGSITKVFLASNCSSQMREDIDSYASLAKIPVIDLDFDNAELGVFCKKNFFVSVLGVESAGQTK